MENLTKENFWNEMTEKYPIAMEKFCSWIDKYKKDNNWKGLFTKHDCDCPSDYDNTINLSPKYHDLPIAFQIGIWFEFVRDRGGCYYDIDLFDYNPKTEIEEFLKIIEEEE